MGQSTPIFIDKKTKANEQQIRDMSPSDMPRFSDKPNFSVWFMEIKKLLWKNGVNFDQDFMNNEKVQKFIKNCYHNDTRSDFVAEQLSNKREFNDKR